MLDKKYDDEVKEGIKKWKSEMQKILDDINLKLEMVNKDVQKLKKDLGN